MLCIVGFLLIDIRCEHQATATSSSSIPACKYFEGSKYVKTSMFPLQQDSCKILVHIIMQAKHGWNSMQLFLCSTVHQGLEVYLDLYLILTQFEVIHLVQYNQLLQMESAQE